MNADGRVCWRIKCEYGGVKGVSKVFGQSIKIDRVVINWDWKTRSRIGSKWQVRENIKRSDLDMLYVQTWWVWTMLLMSPTWKGLRTEVGLSNVELTSHLSAEQRWWVVTAKVWSGEVPEVEIHASRKLETGSRDNTLKDLCCKRKSGNGQYLEKAWVMEEITACFENFDLCLFPPDNYSKVAGSVYH